jgi:translocation protein SEC66
VTPLQANALAPGWGNTIFQSANEMAANAVLRTRLDEIQEKTDAEKEWWDRRRDTIRQDFEKELNEEAAQAAQGAKVGSDDEGVLVDSGSTSVPSTPGKKKKGKK